MSAKYSLNRVVMLVGLQLHRIENLAPLLPNYFTEFVCNNSDICHTIAFETQVGHYGLSLKDIRSSVAAFTKLPKI